MPDSGQKNPWSFSLAELLIGTTFVCVLLAVTLALPEWGIFLWILSGFALTRTIWYSIAWKRAGKAFSPLAQIGSLAESLLVMALISAAATVAFMGVCLPLGLTVTRCCAPNYSELLSYGAWGFGGVAGLASGGYLLWRLWIAAVVQWWRKSEPPTFLARVAALGQSIVVLASTLLASGSLALTAGLAWLQALAGRPALRDERPARLAMYWLLVSGYVLGAALGVIVGRTAARRVRRWFWQMEAAAGGVAVVLWLWLATSAFGTPPDDSGMAAALLGLDVALMIGLAIYRVVGTTDDA